MQTTVIPPGRIRPLTAGGWKRLGAALEILAVGIAVPGTLVATQGALPDARTAALGAAYLAAWLTFTMIVRGNQGSLPEGAIDLVSRALGASAIGLVLVLATASLVGASHPALTALWLAGTTLASVCAARLVLLFFERRARRRGTLSSPALLVGAGAIGAQIARRLKERPELGLDPVGFLESDPGPQVADLPPGVPLLGELDDLPRVAAQTEARHAILAFSAERDHRLAKLVEKCQELGLEVSVVPRLFESMNHRASLEHIGGLPLVGLRAVDPRGWRFALKYALDQLVALAALLSLAPLLVAIAVAVRLSSPGPVIFRQRRVGRDNEIFELFKFRTMQSAAAADFLPGAGLAPGGIEGQDRRTAVGRWLRQTSLDELPQLLNVARGQMSLIGPRPERPQFVERFEREIPYYAERHRVKPGITGWAQVNGLRGPTSIADRAEWDRHYIHNWSLALELRIVAMTLAELTRFGERDAPVAVSSQAGRSDAQERAEEGDPRPLRLVEAPDGSSPKQASAEAATRWFCGYCGAPPIGAAVPTPTARVCQRCGTGLLLEASEEVAPAGGEPFMVVDSQLTVQALSQHAERMLAVSEPQVTNRPVSELLVAADSEQENGESFAQLLGRAASSDEQIYGAFVRPRSTFGVRLRARIGYCGPPRAALLVLETSPTKPQLRLVVHRDAVQPRARAGQR